MACDAPGDPKKFYFVFPSDSEARGHLDINAAVKADGGATPACLLYLNHILGPERATIMNANRVVRDRHLTVVSMPNFQNTGFDTIVMRYTEAPNMGTLTQSLAKYANLGSVPGFVVLSGIGAGMLGFGGNELRKRKKGDPKALSSEASSAIVLGGLAALGIPVAVFVSALKVAREDRARLLESEARRMGTQFQQWQETALSAAVPSRAESDRLDKPEGPQKPKKQSRKPEQRLAQAGDFKTPRELRELPRKPDKFPQAGEFRAREFRRVRELSPESRVAGGADPRTDRTKKARSPKREQSPSRSASERKLARAGKTESRKRDVRR